MIPGWRPVGQAVGRPDVLGVRVAIELCALAGEEIVDLGPIAVPPQGGDVDIGKRRHAFPLPRLGQHPAGIVYDTGTAIAGVLTHGKRFVGGEVGGHHIHQVLDGPRLLHHVLRIVRQIERISTGMAEHFRAAQGKGLDQFRILHFFRCHGTESADGCLNDGKHGIKTVEIEVTVPIVVRCRCVDGIEPAIAQRNVAGVIENDAGLKIGVGKVLVSLVRVGAEEDAIIAGDLGQRILLGAVDIQRGPIPPFVGRKTHGEISQHIFRQDYQLHVGPTHVLGTWHKCAHPFNRLHDHGAGRFFVRTAVDGIAGDHRR